jgi:hypothetical protein
LVPRKFFYQRFVYCWLIYLIYLPYQTNLAYIGPLLK